MDQKTSDDIICIKQLLVSSIKNDSNDNFNYIFNLIHKNVNDCNLLYTQVCYLIKLFLLYDYETNKNKFNDYKFDELFIRKCFKLIKNDNLDLETNNSDSLINRMTQFYIQYNHSQLNQFKFSKPDNVLSITHITDALSRDIQTNITNNIIINYHKYIKEYVSLNLKLKFNNIDDKQINKIYNDIISNTFTSNDIYHDWIKVNKKIILPNFDNKKNITISNFKDGVDNHYNIFIKFIDNYVNENQDLLNFISINNDNKSKITKLIINKLKDDTIDNNLNINYIEWIKDNKNNIINKFNSIHKVDLDKELEKNPYLFIPYMLSMNKNLELNNSKKKYQIIPLRTNLTPKFIPISIDSLVDMLDSKYLLGNIKNYYHNNNKKGLILFDTYFNFDSKYIKNIIKKGYVFSGLIYTNGYEINYIFNSSFYNKTKNEYHLKKKNSNKYIKENTFNLNEVDKKLFMENYEEDKKKKKKELSELNKEKNKKLKQTEKENLNKILSNIEKELNKLKNEYENNLLKIKEKHYYDLNLELGPIDKTKKENKKIMQDIMNKYNDLLISKNVYLEHEFNRNYSSLIDDYNNNIDLRYNDIKNKELINNESINKIKSQLTKLKSELKIIKKQNVKFTIRINKKEKKKLNTDLSKNKSIKKIIRRIIDKINVKLELLNYELIENKSITKIQINNIKNVLIKLILKLKEFNLLNLNNYLNENEINLSLKIQTIEFKFIINNCLKYLSIDLLNLNNENMNLIMKLIKLNFEKIKNMEFEKNSDYKLKYKNKINELNETFSKLNKLMNEKRTIEKEKMIIFKGKNNENLKVDEMSKKTLSLLNKMNWVVIDPGVNSILTMLSNDGKTKMTYSKSEYLSKTKRKKTEIKKQKIKKEKITKIENTLTKENLRLKTSNDYKTFNQFVTLKMKIHNQLTKLYNDIRLNKLKWFTFINTKRSETNLINKIKKTFINEKNKNKDLVLLLGDWSMNKKGIKSISTPNKKYEKILSKNFITLKLNEFRTSIIDNKTELKCENAIRKIDYKKLGIKEIYSLEKLKKKDKKKYKNELNKPIHKILTCKTSKKFNKYINRDMNAVKNMKKIITSYLTVNKKPMIFVMGTKICNNDFIII